MATSKLAENLAKKVRQQRRRRLSLEALEDRTLLAANPIVAENLLPGSNDWGINGVGDTTLEGFATEMSVDQGQTVQFKVNNTSGALYRVDVYRMGYYQGLGARKVATIPSSQTLRVVQPAPLTDAATGLVDAGNWSVTASWAVPSNATSGIYFARLVREDTGGASHVFFVVRDDDGASDLMFQTSDTTWQAYNDWGGSSTYIGNGAVGRAYKVSYNRPLSLDDTSGGHGTYNSPFHAEYPMVRWLEANGYNVSYTSNVDTHRYGAEILEHKAFLSVGHDEYWSAEMRANVEAARDAGVNLAFLTGNEVFWKVRFENSIDASGTPYRTLVTYKESKDNAEIDPSPEWTGTWRDNRFSSSTGRPENALTGSMYMVDRTNVDLGISMQVPAADGQLRFWRDTAVANLAEGQVATLGQYVVGYETNEDLDNGFRPAGLITMSSTTFTTPFKVQVPWGTIVGPGVSTHKITLYRAASGAIVFGAGTVQWSWGLDEGRNPGLAVPNLSMQQATVNLFADMYVQPETLQAGLVRAAASTDIARPTSTITSPTGGNYAVGSTVTITGTAADVGGVVGGVEVSVDGGRTWHRANGRASWSYTWVIDTPGTVVLLSRAADDSGNVEAPSGGVAVNVAYQPTSTGLVAAYGFEEASGSTVTNAAGGGNNGTIDGATRVTNGVFGKALSFDGVNDWVTIADSASLDLTSGMTLQAWVKPTAPTSSWETVLMKEKADGLVYGLYASDGAGAGQPPGVYVGNGGTETNVKGTSVLPVNTWSFLAATYDGSALRLYVNGTLVNTAQTTGSITTSSGALRLGGNSIWGEYFQGLIDQVRIYNRALNVGEILSDMSTAVGATQVETTAPTVSVNSPGNVSGVTNVTASASDNVIVAGVQFLLNGQLLGAEDTAAPYSFSWDTRAVANGTYTLTARARDAAGNVTTSPGVTVTVNNPPDTAAPTIKLLHPGSGSVHGTVIPWVHAADNIGVVGVQFKLNGNNLGAEVTSRPYRLSWDTTTLADGAYTLTAVGRDAAGNTTTTAPVTLTIDNTAPALTAQTPANGATEVSTSAPQITATFGEAIQVSTLSFVVRNPANQVVAGTLTYNESTRTATFAPTGGLEPSATYTVTVSGARDVAGNAMAPATWSFTTTGTVTNATLWPESAAPAVESVADFAAVELGLKFTADVDGYITGVRFYKGLGNTGTHVGRVWSATGTLLGTVTFSGESASGWQQANFANPVHVFANTTYVVSYHAPNGNYAVTGNYFGSAWDAGVLHAPADGNGVYGYGPSGTFPSNSFNATNYWVDVVFSNTLAPTVLSTTPANGATGVSTTSPHITAVFSKPVVTATISLVVKDASNNTVPGTVNYDTSTNTVTFTPSAALTPLSAYTATVSGAQDANGLSITPVTWSFTTAAADVTAPTVTSTTPTAGAGQASFSAKLFAYFNEPVAGSTVSFVLRDAANNVVPGVVTYNSVHNFAIFTPDAPLSPSASYTATVSGAQDLAGNVMAAPHSWSFTTAPVITNLSLYPGSATPAVPSASDGGAVELGLKFTAATDGYITGVKFFKGAGNTGTHVGRLWAGQDLQMVGPCSGCACSGGVCFMQVASGTLLASATFSGESSSGWQQVNFSTPVFVSANTTYVVSYTAPNGGYAYTGGYFASSGASNGALSAPSGNNGVFGSPGSYPTSSFNSTNYWVDVVFSNVLAPSVTATTPATSATGVSVSTTVKATFNTAVTASTISFVVKDAANNAVPGTVTYDSATRTATFTPHTPLAQLATYTATVSGAQDAAGNPMAAPHSWSFTTRATVTNATLFPSGSTPAVASASDTASVELGVRFTADTDGFITGVRFYKGPANTGTHTGQLWTATGTLLASATFSGESASGWQQVNFSTPVPVTANTTYVASYFAPNGGYAVTSGYFTSGVDAGVLHAPAGTNGVFGYGSLSNFPSNSFNATNYWVDVVFSNALTPTVASTTPAAGATAVSAGSPVTVTFSQAMTAASLNSNTFRLRATGASEDVAATVSYSGLTATLTPAVALALNTTYQVTLSGTVTNTAGTPLGDDVVWSFTTQQSLNFVDSTAANFLFGTTDAGTAVTQTGDGEIGLRPTDGSEFFGSSLPSGWASTVWNSGGSAAVANGELLVEGAMASTSALYPAGHPLEFAATFSGEAFQHAGFVAPGFGSTWAMFSTGSAGGALYARTNNGGAETVTQIPGSWMGAKHTFRIERSASSVTYLINGVEVASHAIALTGNLAATASDFNVGGGSLAVDWLRVSPYASSGTFLSRVADAGSLVTWNAATWSATVPSGAGLAVSVRTGNTATPDATWTDFVPLAGSGASVDASSRYLQYRVVLTANASGQAPVLSALTVNYTNASDTTPPIVLVSQSTPASGATGVGLFTPVVIKFNELIDPATATASTITLERLDGAGNTVATVPAGVSLAGSTATLTPTAALPGNTTYKVVVSTGVKDISGNALASPVTWTFTTGTALWQQSYPGGTGLTPSFSDEFAGTSLGSAWANSAWGGSSGTAVSGGTLSVLGSMVSTTGTYEGKPVEARVQFGGTAFQHFGLATSLSSVAGNYWAMFSTGGTSDRLLARVNVNGSTQDIDIGALPSGFHNYRVKPVTGGFEFYVDGTLLTTINASFPTGTGLKVVFSDYNNISSAALAVDWVRLLDYTSGGTVTSAVYDATRAANWGAANWNATLPAGTSLVVETRSGDTASPDAGWSEWAAVANGGTPSSPTARYFQYRVTFVTTDPTATPLLLDIGFLWA